MRDPFLRLTHSFLVDGKHGRGPVFVLPEDVKAIENGKIITPGRDWDVLEDAETIHRLVLEKMAENRQAEVLGKE